MLNDLAWRKVPRGIIRDENLDYISSIMPEELKAAPMLLYFIMYCKADDEGVVDLEDGVIYSRLMKIAKPKEVLDIATLMARQKLLVPVMDGTHVYIIADWEVPPRPGLKVTRTMDERRRAVAEKIKAEQRRNEQTQVYNVNFEQLRAASNPFFCPNDDKNAQFVDTERDKREIRENLESYESTGDRELREFRDREKTHTESNNGDNLKSPYVANENMQEPIAESTDIPGAQPLEATETEIEELSRLALGNDANSNQPMDQSNEIKAIESKGASRDIDEVYVVFSDFFAKNCLGFSEATYKQSLLELSQLIIMLKSDRNPAKNIAAVFCQQFKKLTESEGYYKNLPLLPTELLKPGAYKTVLSMASRILCNSNASNVEWITQSRALTIPNKERAVYDDYKNLMIEYGIDPSGENPLLNLIKKKASAIK